MKYGTAPNRRNGVEVSGEERIASTLLGGGKRWAVMGKGFVDEAAFDGNLRGCRSRKMAVRSAGQGKRTIGVEAQRTFRMNGINSLVGF